MTILFTETEQEWINKAPFNWTVKAGCPADIREGLERKLRSLRDFQKAGAE